VSFSDYGPMEFFGPVDSLTRAALERQGYKLKSPDELVREARAAGRIKPALPEATFVIQGYAAPFNKMSGWIWNKEHGWFRESIAPGAFARSLARDKVEFHFRNHEGGAFGSTADGLLKLEEDDFGLFFAFTPPAGAPGEALLDSIRACKPSGMSFKFRPIEWDWHSENSGRTRTLREVRLIEICPVDRPAYRNTSVRIEGNNWHAEALNRRREIDLVCGDAVPQVVSTQNDDHETAYRRRKLQLAEAEA